jgi:carboxylesterase type B/predicted amidohydrolase YtcJ
MSIRRIVPFLSVALFAGGALVAQDHKAACSTPAVSTSSGPVCGLTSRAAVKDWKGPEDLTASAYLGIPYAVPPVGPLRWQYTTLFQGSEPLQATAYGNACPQSTADASASTSGQARCTDGRTLGAHQSEDCLYLNLWAPAGATEGKELPVMVFIHGGNFDQGSGTGDLSASSSPPSGNLYDGTYLAATGNAIVVTFNYRLGALGFLPQEGTYNFGFADQILALEWVKKNIAHFGGDPHNVTLFGQSAGAKSVGLHTLVSPKSAGLFQAALMESNGLGLTYKSTSQAQELRNAFCASRGPSLCTSAATACDVVEAQEGFLQNQPFSFSSLSNFTWAPTVDHVYITGQPIAAAADLSVPLVLGTNHDEGVTFVYQGEGRAPKTKGNNPPDPAAYAQILDQQFGAADSKKIRSLERYDCGASSDCSRQLVNLMTDFAFTCANRHFAIQAARAAHPQPLYLYQFDQDSSFNFWEHAKPPVPQCKCLVCHADELPYVFNTAWQFKDAISFTQPEEALSQTIGKYWTSFARSRNPGSAWPLFKPKSTYLLLNDQSSTADDPLNATANCSTLWDGIGYGKTAPPDDLVFYGGDVVTMDKASTVTEAVWVHKGKIEEVGPREQVMQRAPKEAERIDLHGGALLPGFIEPHLHLDFLAQVSFLPDLSPCLPAWYRTRADCPMTIVAALEHLKPKSAIGEKEWITGFGIDPSLMTLDGTRPASVFQANPASYIDTYVSRENPVFILDKSGHLAFVNLEAFVKAHICRSVETCGPKGVDPKKLLPPKYWAVGKNGLFTGLLAELQGFEAFTKSFPPTPEPEVLRRAEKLSQDFARTGLTTLVNGGTGTMPFFKELAARSRAHPLLRYRMLLPLNPQGDTTQGLQKPSPWEESNDGFFGVTGIKLVADGSTQGCTGSLLAPYNPQGLCGSAGTGMADYDTQQIIADLKTLWRKGWPFQFHVNGDGSAQTVLDAVAALQADHRNTSPIVLIHFTVDGNPATGEDMVQRVADLRAGRYTYQGKQSPPVDVSVSHLIGHVAYWGGAFQNILDGVMGPEQPDEKGRAARLDATRHDLELGIPFSLHSDTPVTPVNPLWYVEQAVTRNTWFYPHIEASERRPMPGGQNVTIEQALRAVTLEPAIQNGLDHYIGSIEKGKVADLVLLDKNPLRQPPEEIHKIRVLSTFVGGYRNDWLQNQFSKNDQPAQ